MSADLSFRRVSLGQWVSHPTGWRIYARRGRFIPVPPAGSGIPLPKQRCTTLADAVEVCLRAVVLP